MPVKVGCSILKRCPLPKSADGADLSSNGDNSTQCRLRCPSWSDPGDIRILFRTHLRSAQGISGRRVRFPRESGHPTSRRTRRLEGCLHGSYQKEVHPRVQDRSGASRDRHRSKRSRGRLRAFRARELAQQMGERRASEARDTRGNKGRAAQPGGASRADPAPASSQPSRRRTSHSWEKLPRTSLRIHQRRTVLIDGSGVRELRDLPHGPTARGLASRLLQVATGEEP